MSVVAGIVLGVLSRLEETTDGVSAGISSDSAWVAAAFLLGVRGRSGVVGLTVANGAYYAWIALTEPGVPLGGVSGDPREWIGLGVLAGVVFGAAGRLWATGPPGVRLAASLPPAAVLVVEGLEAGGAGLAGAALGLAFPVLSAPGLRRPALLLVASLAAVGATGGLGCLVP